MCPTMGAHMIRNMNNTNNCSEGTQIFIFDLLIKDKSMDALSFHLTENLNNVYPVVGTFCPFCQRIF